MALFAAALLAAVPTGPQPGESAPDFHLTDQTGAAQTLHSLMGPKGLMLVFYRSADW
jgi:peroxiredoxin